jgi:hypothetical protein
MSTDRAGNTAYRAEVICDDAWWMISIPDLGLLTQADHWIEVERQARRVIATYLNVDPADVRVDLRRLDAIDATEYVTRTPTNARRVTASIDELNQPDDAVPN